MLTDSNAKFNYKLRETSVLHALSNAVILGGILTSLGMYFYFAAFNSLTGYYFSDSVRYLFMADYFCGASDNLTLSILEQSLYPPLFPLAMCTAGIGSTTIPEAHIFTIACLTLACIFYYFWLFQEQFKASSKLLAIFVFLVLPGVFLSSMVIASEFLFLGLLLGSLTALNLGKKNIYWYFLAASLIGLSIVTRTVGIALLPCLILAGRNLGMLRLGFCLMLAIAPYVLWNFIFKNIGSEIGYIDILHVHIEQNSLAAIISNAITQLDMMFHYWVRIFDRWVSTQVSIIQALLLTVSGSVFFVRLYRLKPDAVFLTGYFGIILFWPFPQELERFLIILIPFFLAYCLKAVEFLAGILKSKPGIYQYFPTTIFLVLLMISSLPTLIFFYNRYFTDVPVEITRQKYSPGWYINLDTTASIQSATRMERMLQLMQELDNYVEPDSCIYTTLTDVVALYSRKETEILPLDIYETTGPNQSYDASSLRECDFILFLSAAVKQIPQYVEMYPYMAVQNSITPLLIKNISVNKQDQVVAVLAKFDR